MRQIIDAKPYWSGLMASGVVNIPDATSYTNVTFTSGQSQVVGVGTNWPVSDVVNTTVAAAITNPGYQAVVPVSMASITTDTLLYVDSAGTAELVPVLEVTPTSFKANFQYTHLAGFTLTCSSLSYFQITPGYQQPVLTITAVQGATTLLMDSPYAGPTLNSTTAQVFKSYYTFATDLRDFITVVDPQTGTYLQVHYPREKIDWDDPQRAANDWPQYVCDYRKNLNGNMWYELWPRPSSARALYFNYIQQTPDMVARTDRPPAFIDGSLLVMGALADAFRITLPGDKGTANAQLSQLWEQRFQQALVNAMQADNGRIQQAYTWDKNANGLPGGANWLQSHDYSVFYGDW